MSSFTTTANPTPFGFFDADSGFQSDADSMVTFVKRKLGDDVLSVELTKKMVWACFEEATLEYSSIINMHEAESTLMNLLGVATGSAVSGSFNIGPHGKEALLQRFNLDFASRTASAFSTEAFVGGDYNQISGSIQLVSGQQDYDIYSELKDEAGTALTASMSSPGKMRVTEVFHFDPQAAYRFFDTTSAMNYLSNEFAFESFTPETVFYVLPVFEDVLRAGQMDLSNRVRRSNFSYKIIGTKIRVYPTPTAESPKKLFMRVLLGADPFNPAYEDASIFGTSNASNAPLGHLTYQNVNSTGRQWIRQYSLSCAKELLGMVRNKFSSVPIPGGDVTLNGAELVSQGQAEKEAYRTQLKEQLDKLTYGALITSAADEAEALNRLLRLIPMPNGLTIFTG
ncbi:MAG: hypothetical protein CMA72_09325 [Euryarchaeota archaeon]|nr:hypothetical protein [Euryarchaeota archaeon]|tara:strand:+ start:864 stop:2054 length:1191 start_codon:yes stop_codon:yes gene_type:complete